MKKLVIIIIILLILAGGGGGAYYYFVVMEEDTEEMAVEKEVPEETEEETAEQAAPEGVARPVIKKDMDYYVTSGRLNVRAYPDTNSSIRAVLQKGDKITAEEISGDWVRIGGYEVHDSGKDMAQWVHMSYLSHKKPIITAKERRKMTTALIKKSDDFNTYQDVFIETTQKLIGSGDCKIEDFELINGWIRSITYKDDPIYFIYCGGTEHRHKIYLNVETGQIYLP